jgi:hypothetical protein
MSCWATRVNEARAANPRRPVNHHLRSKERAEDNHFPVRTVIGEIEPCPRSLADVSWPDGLGRCLKIIARTGVTVMVKITVMAALISSLTMATARADDLVLYGAGSLREVMTQIVTSFGRAAWCADAGAHHSVAGGAEDPRRAWLPSRCTAG